ncbi:MAG: flagellar hook-associated protein FlgK [Chitinivibrionales bacterium]
MSLFSVLNVATTGLTASQLGMDVAGQNITNADVDGYSRKRLNTSASYRSDGTYGQMGMGVDVINIQRMRSGFIDDEIRDQTQQVGYYTQIDQTYQNLQSIFTEPSNTGLQEYMDQFFDSWQNLANNPADTSARTMVKTDGEILTNTFHNLASQLSNARQAMNDQITQDADKVNQLTKDIYNLNSEIASVQSTGQNANDSLDKRDKDMTQLAKLIDFTSQENSLGQVTISTGGSLIVSPAYQQDIETTTSTYKAADGSTITNVGLRFKDSKIDYMPQSGEIRAFIDSRDQVMPEYQTKLDTLANALVAKVNAIHETGYDLNGVSGNDFFDPTSTGASDIKLSPSIESNVQNIAAAAGGQTLVAPAQNLVLTYGQQPEANLGHANVLQNSVIVTTAGGATLTEGTDYQVDYQTGDIQLLGAGYNGTPLTVTYSYTAGSSQGTGDNTNAVAIAQLREQMTMDNDALGNSTSTYSENYASMIGRLGEEDNEAKSNLDSRTSLVTQYQNQQDAISGVSLDEEMANLVQLQHTYEASARVVTTAGTMLDSLIAMVIT